ncbi:TrkH family potassium uptake protein [Rothia sp. ZJ932]|uniref:TrkH family potassium uptake protein n=1 Tax=Rothia sp. ZJ932 TaxID=2810516 RepID=UPI0019684D0B|nr:potassium transporter TrkG [Rothia sp. ZJ932]QRZ61980.1 TrkH family potassium uptake protein [Rothia sp. ZJ932]
MGIKNLATSSAPTLPDKIRTLIDRTVGSSPSRVAISAFLLVIIFFSLMLYTPLASRNGQSIEFHHAVFTATSAVTVTGLTTVPTGVQWSFFGQLMILLAFQVGGLGTLTMTSLLAIAVGRKMGLRSKMIAQEAMNIGRLGEVGSILRTVAVTSISLEATIAVILTPRFWLLGESFWEGVWHGIFYAVSAFNNAGFTPHTDGIVPYGHDLWILLPLCLGVFVGALGFPVILTLQRNLWHFKLWNLTTKLTLIGTTSLLFVGMFAWGFFEWNNPATIGAENIGDKTLHAFFASMMTRSGGFNLVDMSQINPITLLLTDVLMFIGGGSASTAGGVKITTFCVVLLAILAEARGDQHVIAFTRTIPDSVLRIAISVISMSTLFIFLGCAALVYITDESFDRVLFEVISAYATCGLSVGLSAELPPAGTYILALLMFVGRIGTNTVATGLALRSRRRLYKYPEERPIIG